MKNKPSVIDELIGCGLPYSLSNKDEWMADQRKTKLVMILCAALAYSTALIYPPLTVVFSVMLLLWGWRALRNREYAIIRRWTIKRK